MRSRAERGAGGAPLIGRRQEDGGGAGGGGGFHKSNSVLRGLVVDKSAIYFVHIFFVYIYYISLSSRPFSFNSELVSIRTRSWLQGRSTDQRFQRPRGGGDARPPRGLYRPVPMAGVGAGGNRDSESVPFRAGRRGEHGPAIA